jgi:CRP-like cAMP-binding protein
VADGDALARIPIFSQIRPQELDRLAKTLVSHTFPRGGVIIKEGDRAVGLFVITKGSAEVVEGIGTKRERRLATLGLKDFFGEMAVLDGRPASAAVRALEDTECLVLSRPEFLAELRRNPQMAVSMLPVLSQRLRESQRAEI